MSINKQKGFSIVEIMLAISISLVLMLGLLQTFISNKNTYRLESRYNRLNEDARFLHTYLGHILRNTAYRSPQKDNMFNSMENIYGAGTPFITGLSNSGQNNSDSFTIRYQGSGNGTGTPDGTVLDCLNQAIDAFTTATMTFSISGNNELQCRSQNPNAGVADNTQVILPGVESMHVLYGEDIDQDKSPDRFVDASHPDLNFANVVAIKISLLLRSEDQVAPLPNSTTYNLVGTNFNPGSDNFLRQPITFTIMLRNVVTEVTA